MVHVRPARPTDADALAATIAEGFESYRAFASDGWQVPGRLELSLGLAARLRDQGLRAWIAEDGDGPAGQVAWIPSRSARRHPVDDPSLADLSQLFVRRAHWGTGLARRLLALAVGDAAAEGFVAMRLFTPEGQARGRRFYEREGWSLAGEPELDEPLGLAVVEYRRRLP